VLEDDPASPFCMLSYLPSLLSAISSYPLRTKRFLCILGVTICKLDIILTDACITRMRGRA